MDRLIPLNKKDIEKGLNLPTSLSSELAYLCGVFAGDGSIYVRTTKHEYVLKCVGNPKDERSFYHLVIGPYFQTVFGFHPTLKLYDSGTTYGFMLFSKSLVTFLSQEIGLPLGSKYDSLKIPSIFKSNHQFVINFIRGVFDTGGSMSFKKRYRDYPYYPVISLSSKSKPFVYEISSILKKLGFSVVETYDYKLTDFRIASGFTIINRIELNGYTNLKRWLTLIGFSSPKHLIKIEKYQIKK